MTRRYLSRMLACSHCGSGVPDAEMREIIYADSGESAGVVHARCEDDYLASLRT